MHYIGASFRLRLWFLPADDASFPLRLTPKILPLPPPLADDALPRAPRPLPLADDTPPRPPPCPLPLADNTPPRAPPRPLPLADDTPPRQIKYAHIITSSPCCFF
eukprot:36755_1